MCSVACWDIKALMFVVMLGAAQGQHHMPNRLRGTGLVTQSSKGESPAAFNVGAGLRPGLRPNAGPIEQWTRGRASIWGRHAVLARTPNGNTDPKEAHVKAMLAVLSLASSLSGPAHALSKESQAILDMEQGKSEAILDMEQGNPMADALDTVSIGDFALGYIQSFEGQFAILAALALAYFVKDRLGGGGGPMAGA